jgi:hypothetical protein
MHPFGREAEDGGVVRVHVPREERRSILQEYDGMMPSVAKRRNIASIR